MDKFWQWMKNKGYASWSDGEWCLDTDGGGINPTPQMMVGYYLEYLHFRYKQIGECGRACFYFNEPTWGESIKSFASRLKKRIIELDKEDK